MAYTLIDHTYRGLGSNGGSTLAIDSTGGTLLVVTVSSASGAAIPSVSDSKSNTYTQLTTRTGGSSRVTIFYCASPTVGINHTITASGSGLFCSAGFLVFDGSAAIPFDQ